MHTVLSLENVGCSSSMLSACGQPLPLKVAFAIFIRLGHGIAARATLERLKRSTRQGSKNILAKLEARDNGRVHILELGWGQWRSSDGSLSVK